ncbi:MAG: NADH-quinone oxidoreductase subunit H [Candidatus Methanomethylicus sp.]|nr:NADH-quinone oxidoreductase subunit H [Candidatus Methanomethylicus sp.]
MEPFLSIFQTFIFPGFLFFIGLAFFFEWLDRKFYADMQSRVGPLYTGPRGILQPIADFIKLMIKEDLTPKYADKKIFNSVPVIMCALMLTAITLMPVMGNAGIISFSGDIVLAITAMTFFCILVFLAGFSSVSRYSAIGAERAVLQLLGFEIPLMLSIVGVCIASGSVEIAGIVSWQGSNLWNIAGPQLLGFIIFLVAAQAELERIPFDIPEAEQEIVAGWVTEYSGRKLAIIRLSRNLELVFISALAVALYLGGPYGPLVAGAEAFLLPLYFVLKMFLVLAVLVTVRAVFARVRIDQMVSFAWRYLIPLSLLQILITVLWRAL